MTKEIIDIFDENYNKIGTAERREAHLKGLWHQTFQCWILQENGKLLVQLRHKDKSTHPNKLYVSAGGHLDTGETPLDGIREMEEEIGLVVDKKDLVLAGTRTVTNSRIRNGEPYTNKEFNHVYFYKSKYDISEYAMQEDEVDGLFELDIQDGLRLFSKEVTSVKAKGILRESDRSIIEKEFTIEDFVPHPINYFMKVLIMAERINEGKKYLAM